jgi:hypothetical protein
MPDQPSSDASTIPWRVGQLETTVIGHANRIDSLEDWRAELRGAMQFVKFALGTSIITGVVATLTLLSMLSGVRP